MRLILFSHGKVCIVIYLASSYNYNHTRMYKLMITVCGRTCMCVCAQVLVEREGGGRMFFFSGTITSFLSLCLTYFLWSVTILPINFQLGISPPITTNIGKRCRYQCDFIVERLWEYELVVCFNNQKGVNTTIQNPRAFIYHRQFLVDI